MRSGKATNKPGGDFRQSELGSEILEFALVLPFFALILSAILLMGPYIHIRFATHQAAYDCAISAAQTLSREQGVMQGITAAQQSFAAFNLDYGNARIDVAGDWARRGQAVCTVAYRVPLETFPFAIVVNLPREVSSSVALPVQTWKSIWR